MNGTTLAPFTGNYFVHTILTAKSGHLTVTANVMSRGGAALEIKEYFDYSETGYPIQKHCAILTYSPPKRL